MELDLANFGSVRRFVQNIVERKIVVDVLVNNAGMTTSDMKKKTSEGIHIMWGNLISQYFF